MPHYPELQLYVAGKWRRRDGAPVINPGDEPFSARRRTRPAPISSRTWCCNPALRKSSMYSDVSLFIDGNWTKAAAGRTIPVVNPATGEDIGTVAHADKNDLDRALRLPTRGFARGARSPPSIARRSCAKLPICCAIGPMRSRPC